MTDEVTQAQTELIAAALAYAARFDASPRQEMSVSLRRLYDACAAWQACSQDKHSIAPGLLA